MYPPREPPREPQRPADQQQPHYDQLPPPPPRHPPPPPAHRLYPDADAARYPPPPRHTYSEPRDPASHHHYRRDEDQQQQQLAPPFDRSSPHDSSPSSSSYRSGSHIGGYAPSYSQQHTPGSSSSSSSRPIAAVLAAIASSDLEYSGIMPPPSDYRRSDAGDDQSYRPQQPFHSRGPSSAGGNTPHRGGYGGGASGGHHAEPGSTPPHISHLVHPISTSPHQHHDHMRSGGPLPSPIHAPDGYRPYLHDRPMPSPPSAGGERFAPAPWEHTTNVDLNYHHRYRSPSPGHQSTTSGSGAPRPPSSSGGISTSTSALTITPTSGGGAPGPAVASAPQTTKVKAESNANASPPAKRRRTAKAAANANLTSDIPEGAEVEYDDPLGDATRGPLFVHPPKGAVQACIRCHRIKRKCDGAWPRCASCTRADVPCVFELSAATSSYISKLKATSTGLRDELSEAHERIAALENRLGNGGGGGDEGRHGDGYAVSAAAHHVDPDRGERSSRTRESTPRMRGGEFHKLANSALAIRGLHDLEKRTGPASTAVTESVAGNAVTDLITKEEAQRAASAFFAFNQLAYPFLDKDETMAELDDLYAGAEPSRRSRSVGSENAEEHAERRRFLLHMVLAIGMANTTRLGDAGRGAGRALFDAAMPYRAKAVEREDVLCVQALLLLTLYAMSDPASGSMWQAVGLAGRVITAIGLHRRAEPSVASDLAEKRRRVFYSFYNMDRLIASTLSKPLTITEDDIDIELPSDRPEDSTYRGIPIMSITRYIIDYRRLLGVTLVTLYSVSSSQNSLPERERRRIVMGLHEDLDLWSANSVKPDNSEASRTINHDKWLEIMYYQLLCMLYRPSPLYPATTPATLRALHDASSRCVGLYVEMWRVNKVSFNLVQIIGLFVASISFLCCLCECDARMRTVQDATPEIARDTLAEIGMDQYTSADDAAWHAEIRTRVQQCRDLFDAFGHAIPLSAKYRDIFSRLSELLLARHGPLDRERLGAGSGSGAGSGATSNAASQTASNTPRPESAERGAEQDMGVAATVNGGREMSHQPMLMEAPADVTMSHPHTTIHPDPTGAITNHTTQPPSAPMEQTMSSTSAPLGLVGAPIAETEIAGAWDAMTQLWYDLGDLFGDDTMGGGGAGAGAAAAAAAAEFVPFDEAWADHAGEPHVGDVWWNQVA